MENSSAHSYDKIDKATFETIFKTFFPGLCAFANKFTRDFDAAKDIVHDVFVNFWHKRDSIDAGKNIKSYLFTSVNNRCLNYIRDHKKFDQNEREIPDGSSWENSDHLVQAELEEKINDILNELPEKCREVFLLNRYEGLKYKEIAEKLGISVKTVEAQMSKALRILKEKLVGYIQLILIGWALFWGY